MKTILFFGNSLTAGYGVGQQNAFPALIQKLITEASFQYQIVNAGVSGETSSGGKYRIHNWIKKPMDVFVLELGANDGLRGIPARETSQNLQEIIDVVKKHHPETKIVLAGMEIPDIFPGRYAAEFRVIFRELALKNNITFIPFLLEGVVGVPHLNLPDHVHPNTEGHKMIAKHVWPFLKEVLV